MREVVIVEAVRTPLGRRNGKLKDVHPVVLGSLVLKELLKRAGIEPTQVDDVVFGCVSQVGEQSLNVARNAWLTAGFPVTTPATTVDRQCGSSHQAVHFPAHLNPSGEKHPPPAPAPGGGISGPNPPPRALRRPPPRAAGR